MRKQTNISQLRENGYNGLFNQKFYKAINKKRWLYPLYWVEEKQDLQNQVV